MNTPVTLLIFNRPDTTEKVFAEIAKAQPPKLFVVADGPRPNHPDDIQRCAATRGIIDRVDWDCEVYKNYSDINLGCGVRPATGISWVFEQVEQSIILEDDILPHPTFFPVCEELLERFQDNERIMMVSGMKSQFGERGTIYNEYSYGFRRALCCWGWATWRRAWQHYDFEIKMWSKLRDLSWLLDITRSVRAVEYYKKIFDEAFNNKTPVGYWDYQWLFACWLQNGHCVMPNVNLTINIGFGEGATHTKSRPEFAVSSLEEMLFPLKHPPFLFRDFYADIHRYELRFSQKTKFREWKNFLREVFRRLAIFLRVQSLTRYSSEQNATITSSNALLADEIGQQPSGGAGLIAIEGFESTDENTVHADTVTLTRADERTEVFGDGQGGSIDILVDTTAMLVDSTLSATVKDGTVGEGEEVRTTIVREKI